MEKRKPHHIPAEIFIASHSSLIDEHITTFNGKVSIEYILDVCVDPVLIVCVSPVVQHYFITHPEVNALVTRIIIA